ncbi:tRNA(Ile)-lysidine synthase [Luteibacter sp. Sphag1AF]|uniref:tRNA lysidine(34) synthetase TilS n=1 Tax=Luteibacter sp. Sphag1AF TaxID=2587031 RepID=UPI001613A744|nr:tRNA lysidine(34) synthetase TilS [Luteibacter sp. Sphag1AF]MBB3225528.1 tRNA(Ile)-lysidine synthase [Luteibacter sp. Sphag1AF]
MKTALVAHLKAALTASSPAPLLVAFSGGPDSTALLHALASLPRGTGLRAVHVDHGLQAASGAWSAHAAQICAGLDVPLETVRVTVDLTRGEGIESAARRARYGAFASVMRPGERIVLAHHREDQVETILLKLLRGAGPDGLSGMRAERPFGLGTLWRPLLDLPRTSLLAHLGETGLHAIHDPSNDDARLARSYLRASVVPTLTRYWPQAATSLTHSAGLCADAADYLRGQWLDVLPSLRDDHNTLDAAAWLALHPALRVPLLDYWLHEAGRCAPTTAQRLALERQIHEARIERLPCVAWADTEVRVWRGRLWAMPRQREVDPDWEASWSGEPLALPGGGTLTLPGARLPRPLTVRVRRGGERLKPVGDRHTRELRDLFQGGAMPPWLRPRCPLIHDGETLVAVAGRWISEAGEKHFATSAARPVWQPDD